MISKQYCDDPAVGGPLNKTGVWRPITNSISGLDTQGALWGPGDAFEDPATGERIDFGQIDHYLAANPASSPYTADDTATITVTKAGASALSVPVALSDAKLTSPTTLTFTSSAELQDRITDSNSINNGHDVYIREGSRLTAGDVTLTRADGTTVPASAITSVAVTPAGAELTLAPGTFSTAASAQGLKLATKPFFNFAASTAVPVVPQLADFGGTVPATLSLTLGGPVSLGVFIPGTAKVYSAASTATVTSTAGDATLTATPAGRLANGTFSLAQPLLVTADKATWTGPVSNDIVHLELAQAIGANEALRTGAYSTTVTFTLSTTTP